MKPLNYTHFMELLSKYIDHNTIFNTLPELKNAEAITGISLGAKDYAKAMFKVVETWRKLSTNRVQGVTTQDVNDSFVYAILDHSSNPFFAIYSEIFNTLLLSGRGAWTVAEVFRDNGGDVRIIENQVSRMFEIFPMIVYCVWTSVELDDPFAKDAIAYEKMTEFAIQMQASVQTYVKEV